MKIYLCVSIWILFLSFVVFRTHEYSWIIAGLLSCHLATGTNYILNYDKYQKELYDIGYMNGCIHCLDELNKKQKELKK